MAKTQYLKPNVVIEPLVDNWYAWSHLISPGTAAMNITERHMKIMESYLTAPEIHAQAVQNPSMRGGPFMDYSSDRTSEVQELIKDTRQKRKVMLELSNAIKQLHLLLAGEATGSGLEKLYEKIPVALHGYVELFYDLNNHPGFRFYEFLLYESKYYDTSAQSIALWLTNNDERPFSLSTPRLYESNVFQCQIPFHSALIDRLAQMKYQAADVDTLMVDLGVPASDEILFRSLFTDQVPPMYERYTGEHIRMRYFGHACILVETKDISILVDPLISYYGYDSTIEHFSDLHLPETLDYVLITHNHQDHVLLESLLPLRHRIKNIIVPSSHNGRLEDPDLKLMFNKLGFRNVIALNEMGVLTYEDTQITALPFVGEHSDLNIMSKACYLVTIGQFKLFFCADSRIVNPVLYKHIQCIIGDIDVLFLGMECDGAPLSWLYGPLMPQRLTREQDTSRRLSGSDCAKGTSLIEIFRPKEVYIYAMGQEPWVEFISSIKYTPESNPIVQSDRLISQCLHSGVIAERLFGEKEILYEKKSVGIC